MTSSLQMKIMENMILMDGLQIRGLMEAEKTLRTVKDMFLIIQVTLSQKTIGFIPTR